MEAGDQEREEEEADQGSQHEREGVSQKAEYVGDPTLRGHDEVRLMGLFHHGGDGLVLS